MPENTETVVPEKLGVRELRHIARQFLLESVEEGPHESEKEMVKINQLFAVNPLTDEKEEDPEIENFRKKILETYEGNLLGT